MLREKLVDIFSKVQQSSWTHHRCKQQLANVYKSFPQKEFLNEFVRCLTCIFMIPMHLHSPKAIKGLIFAAEFMAKFVTSDEESDSEASNSAEDESNGFVSGVLQEVLDYHDAIDVNVRYCVVQFVALFLHKIPDNAHLTVNDWIAIEKVMLELMEDKAAIRVEAVKCLVRLQQPSNVACPVTAAYLSAIYDPNPLVRKEIVSSIHASAHTIPKIIERVRDTNHKVRLEVYKRCARMGPRILRLADRQLLLDVGFHEGHVKVRQYFLEQMLPCWLTSYNGSIVALLNAIKLDASEEDIRRTETLWEKVLKELFKSVPLLQIIDDLSLGEDRLIPIDKLCPETATLWSNLVQHVQSLDNGDNYIDAILPELLPFTIYIEKVLKRKKAARMQTWEYLAHQQVVSKLFQIVQTHDFTEEIGRQAIRKLLNNTIKYEKWSNQVLQDMFVIFENLQPNSEQLIEEVAVLIHEIREEEVSKAVEPSQDVEFKLAQVRVRIEICTDELEEAIHKEDFEKAAQIKNALDSHNKELEELSSVGVRIEKVVRDDLDTVCKFLDVLIALLSRLKLCAVLPILLSIKDELVEPLLKYDNVEVDWRVLNCLSLFALLDRNFAAQNFKFLCAPLIFYHTNGMYLKQALLVSARAATDMFRLYGGALFGQNNETTQNMTTSTSCRRRLFRMSTDQSNMELASFGCDDIVEILVEMLDDEDDKIVEMGGKCLRSLVITGTVSSPTLMTRLILKWLNPLVEKLHPMLSQLLIRTIMVFAREGKNSDEVLEQAVLPVLTQIGTAPNTSPLHDTNTNGVVNFLADITSLPNRPNMFVKTHYNIAHALCDKMAKQPTDCCVSLYIKMMMKLRFHPEETVSNADLAKQIELLLPQIENKTVSKSVAKLVRMLKDVARVNEAEVVEGMEDPQSGRSRQSNNEEEEVVSRMRDLNVHNSKKKQSSKKDEQPNNDITQGQDQASKKNKPSTISKEKMPLQIITNNTQMRQTRSSSSSASSNSSQDIGAKIRNEIEVGKKTLLVNVALQDLDKMAADIKKKRKRRRKSASSGNGWTDFVTSSGGDETVLHSISENEPEIEVLTTSDASLSSSQRSSLGSSRVISSNGSADTSSPPRKALRSSQRKRKQIST